jgi:predicted nucleic acid-binding protein
VILVDTSVWAQHIDRDVPALTALLDAGQVLTHPFVIGEVAMGNLRKRESVLRDLDLLPRSPMATDSEVLLLVKQSKLFGRGIGYVDAHLLASARLSAGASLWTFDKRLGAAAIQLRLGAVGAGESD